MPEAVEIRLESLELPTYVRGPDSPYPAFTWAGWRYHYPYCAQVDMSLESRPVKHRAVVLENRYVRVTVLPDLGGKIFSLYDKTAKQDAFMVPPSIKFQNIALRGAWLAGGIELNYGSTHHTSHTVSPITWAMRRDEDGGASVWVGSITRPVEGRYAARIRLRPDRAAMDLEIHSMGPQQLPGMMYWWSNAGVEVGPQSRFYYFGLYAESGHGRHSWPVADGLDYSWYRNRATGSDMFLMDAQRDELAFYDFARRHGVCNIAHRHLAPGQKYFTWGNDPIGRYWDLLLSDAEQTYCEIQRGRLPSQGITEPIPPMSDDTWSEVWMPLNATEGFSAAANDLVLSLPPPKEQGAKVALRLLSAVPRAAVRVEAFAGEQCLGRFDVPRLEPGQPALIELDLPDGLRCDAVKVFDAAGLCLMDWHAFEFKSEDWFNDVTPDPFKEDAASADRLFHEAQKWRFHLWPHPHGHARGLYEKILKQDGEHSGANQALAEMALHAGQYDLALEHVNKALKRRPLDAGLKALAGWIHLRLGHLKEAEENFWWAQRYENGRKDGLVGLAWTFAKAGRWADALDAADRLLAERSRDKWGRLLRLYALRRLGRREEAVALLKELLAEDPLWSKLHAEALLLGVPVDIHAGTRKLGDDSVTAAMPYLELGLWDDAQAVLAVDESNEPFSPAVRLSHLLYAQHRAGRAAEADATLQQLRQSPPEQANPWTTTSLDVLTELVLGGTAFPGRAAQPGKPVPPPAGETPAIPTAETAVLRDEPMLRLMLGNVLADRGRVDEAAAQWRRAAELGMRNTVLEYNLAQVAAHAGDKAKALEHYRRSWELSGRHMAAFAALDIHLASMGLHADRLALYDPLPEAFKTRSATATRRVVMLLDNGLWKQALDELDRRQFLIGEFERHMRTYYLEALLGVALPLLAESKADAAIPVLQRGLEYPRNLNVGRSDSWPDEAATRYWLGVACELAGKADQARAYWHEAVLETHHDGDPNTGYTMLAWLALGRRQQAISIMHRLEKLGRGDTQIEGWYRHLFPPNTLKLGYGLAMLAKGHVDEARDIWRKALAEKPDDRLFRLHLDIPCALLEKMSRRVARTEGIGFADRTR